MSGSVGPVMRRAARLKPDTAARQRREELHKLAAPDLPFPQGPGPAAAAFTWTVLQDAQHPATLELPVIGTSAEQLSRLSVAGR